MASVMNSIVPQILDNECHLPCNHKTFSLALKMFHKNSYFPDTGGNEDAKTVTQKEESTELHLFYNSMLAEQRSEAYIYDLGNLLTSLGGNLGLFLGFSCFSTLMFFIKHVFKIFLWKKYWKPKVKEHITLIY